MARRSYPPPSTVPKPARSIPSRSTRSWVYGSTLVVEHACPYPDVDKRDVDLGASCIAMTERPHVPRSVVGSAKSLRIEGGLFRPRMEKLLVGSRDCTRLVEGIHKQVGLVRSALDAVTLTDVPVHGALCFIEADWPLIGGSFVIADVTVTWPKKLAERLVAPGPMTEAEVETVHRALAQAFPAA